MPSPAGAPVELREVRHFHLFCGLGAGARGFNRGTARVGNMQAVFRCLGGIDVSPAAIRDFGRLAGVPGTVLDLFDAEQYAAFHGSAPPPGWRAATAEDVQAAAGHERPHIVFLSAPCKGFSGLLAEGLSRTDKYQALNRLTLRGVWLMLEAFQDKPAPATAMRLAEPKLVVPPATEPLPARTSPLSKHPCAWPFGEPGTGSFHFCSHLAQAGKPYCPDHCMTAYVEKAKRRQAA